MTGILPFRPAHLPPADLTGPTKPVQAAFDSGTAAANPAPARSILQPDAPLPELWTLGQPAPGPSQPGVSPFERLLTPKPMPAAPGSAMPSNLPTDHGGHRDTPWELSDRRPPQATRDLRVPVALGTAPPPGAPGGAPPAAERVLPRPLELETAQSKRAPGPSRAMDVGQKAGGRVVARVLPSPDRPLLEHVMAPVSFQPSGEPVADVAPAATSVPRAAVTTSQATPLPETGTASHRSPARRKPAPPSAASSAEAAGTHQPVDGSSGPAGTGPVGSAARLEQALLQRFAKSAIQLTLHQVGERVAVVIRLSDAPGLSLQRLRDEVAATASRLGLPLHTVQVTSVQDSTSQKKDSQT